MVTQNHAIKSNTEDKKKERTYVVFQSPDFEIGDIITLRDSKYARIVGSGKQFYTSEGRERWKYRIEKLED